MATRSMIAFHNGDEVYAIYCNFDGQPAWNGKILRDHYNTIEKVEELLDLGDLCQLGKEIGEKHDFNATPGDFCTAFGRDRGDTDAEGTTHASVKEAFCHYGNGCAEYFYVFDGLQWSCFDARGERVEIPA